MAIQYRDLVKKLMRKANDATELGNEAEAQTYAEKAAALATRHGVEDALTEAFDEERPVTIILKKITVSNPYPVHRINLLSVIARNLGCKVLKDGRNGAELFGDERDVERVMFVYRLISVHMLDAVSKSRPSLPTHAEGKHWYFKTEGLTPAETKSYRVNWVRGYVAGIGARMAEAYKVVVAEQKALRPGAALVLSDRKALVEVKIAETYGKVRRGRAARITNVAAFREGVAAASDADLGQTRINNGPERRRQISA